MPQEFSKEHKFNKSSKNLNEKRITYKAPIDENGNELYVPIVVPNKTFLIGYVECKMNDQFLLSMISEELKQRGLFLDIGKLPLLMDSGRFNDVMPNDKRESRMTQEERKKMLKNMIDKQIGYFDKNMNFGENNPILINNNILDIDCPQCSMYYGWKNSKELPEEDFYCTLCGRKLIHYTNHFDWEYKFDGGKNE